MIFNPKPPHAFCLGCLLLLGPELISTSVHSQGTPTRPNAAPPLPTPLTAPATPLTNPPSTVDESTTNIVQKLSDLPVIQTNDPFANTFAMLKRAATDNPVTSTLSAIGGNTGLQLRGSVVDENDQRLALVEVGKTGVHVVREGDTLSLSGGGRSANVTILRIHRQSIEVEFGNFEDSVIIR